MGVCGGQVEEWLDVCERVVASASVDGEFIRTVLEMIRLSSETNLSYAEVVDEYQAKVTELKQLEGGIMPLLEDIIFKCANNFCLSLIT